MAKKLFVHKKTLSQYIAENFLCAFVRTVQYPNARHGSQRLQ